MSKLFAFMGPSGGGKSTIQHALPKWIKFMTHFATREVREGEIDGYHINHRTREAFEILYSYGMIATKTEYAGNLYGAPTIYLADVVSAGTPYHATVTKDSLEQFKSLLGKENVVSIYIKPPSVEALRERMLARGDSIDAIEKRIEHIYSAAELENESVADYVVVNEHLEDAQSIVLGIIYKELYTKKEDDEV